MTASDSDPQRIAAAVTTWARSVFSAPRRLDELVIGVESRDEVVERVATHVVRRTPREVRAATNERRATRPRVDPSRIDPFAHTPATLKADSEYIAQCSTCAASGLTRCEPCHGTGHGRCPNCNGSGQERSAKTGRPIKCKSCKATGSAPCRNCAGQGSVHCHACLGSGHQLAWLTFHEEERWELSVPISSPIVVAHPALRQSRSLSRDELVTMTIVTEMSASGPLDPRILQEPDRQTVRAQLAQLDPRLERVQFQQYLKLAAIRRDVTFEMCGSRATLSLTGTQLVGATTAEALRPIKRRLYAWVGLCGALCVLGLLVRRAAIGSSSYFDGANAAAGWLVAAAVTCAIPAVGAWLRAWRGGLRFHPIRRSTRLWSVGMAAALVAIAGIGIAARPDPAEIQRALAVNDVARAREIVRAIEERTGPTPEAVALEDHVMLAEASKLTGDDRLRLLDTIAARKGPDAATAADAARSQRLDQIDQAIAAQRPTEALAMLDKWFAGDPGVPVAEHRAQAHEAALRACGSPACQLGEALQARNARTTPERVAAVDAARTRIVDTLDPAHVDAKLVLPRLQQLRQLRDAGTAAGKVALDDADLQARARKAIEVADAGRAAVPLLGNELAVAEELLGPSNKGATGAPAIALDGVTVFLALDPRGQCAGIYAVGDKAAQRVLKSSTWPVARLVSQATGRAATLPPPDGLQTTTRGYAGGVPVVARWRAGEPVELRIGDATP